MYEERKTFLDSLKSEWKLLWASITDNKTQNFQEEEPKYTISLTDERLPQVETLLKDLSAERHQLNVQLEELKSEIETIQEKQNELKATGLTEESLELHLERLHAEGLAVQKELEELSACLEEARVLERSEDLGLS